MTRRGPTVLAWTAGTLIASLLFTAISAVWLEKFLTLQIIFALVALMALGAMITTAPLKNRRIAAAATAVWMAIAACLVVEFCVASVLDSLLWSVAGPFSRLFDVAVTFVVFAAILATLAALLHLIASGLPHGWQTRLWKDEERHDDRTLRMVASRPANVVSGGDSSLH